MRKLYDLFKIQAHEVQLDLKLGGLSEYSGKRIGFRQYGLKNSSKIIHWQTQNQFVSFKIVSGDEVLVSTNCTPEIVSHFLENEVLATILFRRGYCTLHASAVLYDGKIVIICGESCSGKSTLAALLTLKGGLVIADDLCVIQLNEHKPPKIIPTAQGLKVDEDFVLSKEVPSSMCIYDEYNGKYRYTPASSSNLDNLTNDIVIINLINEKPLEMHLQEHLRGPVAFSSIFYHIPVPSHLLSESDRLLRSERIINLLSFAQVYRLNRYGLKDEQLYYWINKWIQDDE